MIILVSSLLILLKSFWSYVEIMLGHPPFAWIHISHNAQPMQRDT